MKIIIAALSGHPYTQGNSLKMSGASCLTAFYLAASSVTVQLWWCKSPCTHGTLIRNRLIWNLLHIKSKLWTASYFVRMRTAYMIQPVHSIPKGKAVSLTSVSPLLLWFHSYHPMLSGFPHCFRPRRLWQFFQYHCLWCPRYGYFSLPFW